MGYDLYNAQGAYFRWNYSQWPKVLQLAAEFDWQPAGTDAPPALYWENGELYQPSPSNWDGEYMTNDLQWVTDEDAKNIALALEAAINLAPAQRLDDIGRGILYEFIDYCFQGGFSIH